MTELATRTHALVPLKWHRTLALSELRERVPTRSMAAGTALVLLRVGDQIYAYEDRCPHLGNPLSNGSVVGGDLVCSGHGWKFDIASGERRGDPQACARLKALRTKVEAGAIWVELKRADASVDATLRRVRSLESLPGPQSWPLLGNLLQLEVSRLHQVLEEWAAEFGPIFKFKLGTRDVLVIADVELGESILRARPHSFRRMDVIEPIFAEIGAAGVFSAEGAAWRAQRRLAMEALSQRNMKGFFPTLCKVVGRLERSWCAAARAGESRDIQADFIRFTLDVTTSLAFGLDVNTIEGDERALPKNLAYIFPMLQRRSLIPFPYWRWVRLPADYRLDRVLKEIRALQKQCVETARRRIAAASSDTIEPSNFVEAMLLARDDAGRAFDEQTIYGNMLTMLLAGEDTTANTLAWVAHYLCGNPEVIERARAEVNAVLGEASQSSQFEQYRNLVYIEAIASEVMRLRPVVPFNSVEANEDLVIGDISVPRGTLVDILVRPPTREASHFYEPERFLPQRWLSNRPSELAHVSRASMPFGAGPRACPGRTLALLELKAAVAMLVRRFDFQRDGSPEQVSEKFSITMRPAGLRMVFTERA